MVEGFAGLIAADEPQTVLIGREVLGNGGTAVDAAVAMYFTMTVSLPSRVGMGGGGLCVLFDGDEGRGEAIEFLPRAATSGGIVPAGVRGIAALHARHGVVRWELLVSPAENLARFGLRVSRAFRNDLEAGRDLIFANESLRRIYTRDGDLPQIGDRIVQAELSGVLAGVRQHGAAYVHAGFLTARLAEASSAVGMPLSAEDVRKSLPELRPTVEIEIGDDVAYFAPPRANGGVIAAQIWEMAEEIGDYGDLAGADAAHVFAEASARAFGDRARWQAADGSARVDAANLVDAERARSLMAGFSTRQHTPADQLAGPPRGQRDDAAAAGFVAVDQFENAVACTFTMNRLFGAGRMAEGTGILLAAPPRSPDDGTTALNAVIVANPDSRRFRLAATAAGGPAGTTALARLLLDTLAGEQPLAEAVAAPRLHHGGDPDRLLVEGSLPAGLRQGLAERGYRLDDGGPIGSVNAAYCPLGAYQNETCQVVSDPRGSGMALRVQ